MNWDTHVLWLQRRVDELRASEDLDAVSVLRLVDDESVAGMFMTAEPKYQRKLSFEIVQYLVRAAKQQRACHMRTELAAVSDHIAHALKAFEWNEKETKKSDDVAVFTLCGNPWSRPSS